MTADAISVFGVSMGEHWKGGFAFVDVLATIEGRIAKPVLNPKEAFPTEGNIYVDKAHWIPDRGAGAVWKVKQTRDPPEGERHALFSAVARGRVGPLEVIPISATASQPDEVRRLLLTGISLGYAPGNSVLLHTTDSVVIGPVRCDHSLSVGPAGVIVKADALADLLGRWDRIDDLLPFRTNWHGHPRTFTSMLDLPQATGFWDCADLSDCIRTVMKFASAAKTDGLSLTKKQIDLLATTLASDDTPRKMAARASRVIQALRLAASTVDELEVVAAFLLSSSAVQSELARIRDDARLEEQRRIAAEESEAKARVAQLVRKEREVRDRVAEAARQLKDGSRKAQGVVDTLIQRMRQRATEAGRDPAEAFANAAVLKAILQTSDQVGLTVEANGSVGGDDQPVITSRSDALTQLESGLRSAGFVQGSAHAVAREVLAASLAGQLLTFTGSLGMLVCDVVAQTLAGGRVVRVSIPVGLLSSAEFTRCLDETVSASQTSDTLSALIIQGINRSALEVFADKLVSVVVDRQFASSDRAPHVLLLATAVSGPGALPIQPSLCELGPIIDTDTLSLASADAGKVQARAAPKTVWSEWTTKPTAGVDLGSVNELAKRMGGPDSLLWRRTLQGAFAHLSMLDDHSPPTPLQSLAFGWLLPRAELCGVGQDQLPPEMKQGLVDSREPDSRIAKLFGRLTPSGDPM